MIRRPPRSTLFPYTNALPIFVPSQANFLYFEVNQDGKAVFEALLRRGVIVRRSEEHTSELQSRSDLVCRLLLEKKKTKQPSQYDAIVHRHKHTSSDAPPQQVR